MFLRRIAPLVVGALFAATSIASVVSPASASMQASAIKAAQDSVGFIVTYQDGVAPIAPNGQPTGENFAQVDLTTSHDIGLHMTAVRFAKTLSPVVAAAALSRLHRDPRVKSVQFDHEVSFGAQSFKPTPSMPRASKSTVKVATAVLSLKALNAWNASTPLLPQLKLTWAAPKSLNGGKLAGYRVEKSWDNKNWTAAVDSTTVRSLNVSTGLSIGTKIYFRVRALTKVGKVIAIGAPSAASSVSPSTAPLKPQLVSSNVIFAGQAASWLTQSLSERGGIPVTYQVTAKAQSGDTQSCETMSNSCIPENMIPGDPYAFTVTATNALATSSSIAVNDPLYGVQWSLYSSFGVHAPKAWEITRGSPTVVVAILDSGITDHPDVRGQTVAGYDFISDSTSSRDGEASGAYLDWDSNPTDAGDYSNGQDSSWHGTHVAGIIAGAQNSLGISGIAPNVKLEPIRVLGSKGGATSDLIAAINWASGLHVNGVPNNANPARVLNLSIGTDTPSGCDVGTQSAFRSAWDRGITAVTAAGNGSFEATNSYPGNCVPTINVGSTGFSGNSSYFSDYGPGVDISAPGGDDRDAANAPAGSDGMILSTLNDGKTTPVAPASDSQASYAADEGTSMASPLVAGIVALIYSVRPGLTSDDVYKVLIKSVGGFKPGTNCANTADQYGVQNGYSMCGAGIVDAGAAVKLARTYKP
jgi:serine protease